RFGRAGELYTQKNLNPEKLSKLLDDMVAKHVAWSPTMSTYEAARDLIRAQNLPWYKELLHPSLEEYYKPSMTRHGTFWTGWTAWPTAAAACVSAASPTFSSSTATRSRICA